MPTVLTMLHFSCSKGFMSPPAVLSAAEAALLDLKNSWQMVQGWAWRSPDTSITEVPYAVSMGTGWKSKTRGGMWPVSQAYRVNSGSCYVCECLGQLPLLSRTVFYIGTKCPKPLAHSLQVNLSLTDLLFRIKSWFVCTDHVRIQKPASNLTVLWSNHEI